MRAHENVTKIAIIDGEKKYFDMQSEKRSGHDEKVYYYMGKGKPYQIGGSMYDDSAEERYFFRFLRVSIGERGESIGESKMAQARKKIGIGAGADFSKGRGR